MSKNIRPLPIGGTFGKNKVALIDAEDFNHIKNYGWYAKADASWPYIVARNKYSIKPKVVRLHRVIMNAKPGQIVDHINGDIFDNRKANLRFCTPSQNNQNSRRRNDNSSGYKGVGKKDGRWRARIKVNGKEIVLGSFKNPQEASKAYIEAAKRYFKEFSNV